MAISGINVFTISGNIVATPERKTTTGGNEGPVQFTVAVNGWKPKATTDADGVVTQGEQRPDYFQCIAWAGVGENILKRYSKGKAVVIQGRLHQNRWSTPDGQTRSRVELIVNDIKPMSGRYVAKPRSGPDGLPDGTFDVIDSDDGSVLGSTAPTAS